MSNVNEILTAFEEALELERELGTRTVEIDRALLRSGEGDKGLKGTDGAKGDQSLNGFNAFNGLKGDKGLKGTDGLNGENGLNGTNGLKGADGTKDDSGTQADFAFLLEGDPQGPVAELLPKMSEAIGYGPDGVKINDPSARVLIVLGSDAMAKWLPGVKARPGQWVMRGETPALITASPTKTYRFFGNNPDKIHALKLRLWTDLKAALARLGKTPPGRA